MKVFGFDTEKHSLVLRGGFGVSHVPINGNNRAASPDFGAFNTASTLGPDVGLTECIVRRRRQHVSDSLHRK